MFCLSGLIKAGMSRRERWNTNKPGTNKCHWGFFFLCLQACRQCKTWVSVKGRQEREAEKVILQQAWQKGIVKRSEFVIDNWLQAFREQKEKDVFV